MSAEKPSTRQDTRSYEATSRREPGAASEGYAWLVFAGASLARPRLLCLPSDGGDVGRSSSSSVGGLRLDDERISRRHATLRRDPNGWSVEDRGSKNGTYVDGVRIATAQPVRLRDGAIVRLGASILVVRRGTRPTDEDEGDDELPGVAPGVVSMRRELRDLARGIGPVLLLGDTGTGKESAARALHRYSPRSDRAFVATNCAELDPATARADLFGAHKGAFTDAKTSRPGLVAAAAEGTLFLDEVGDLDLGVQADLLRFLEDGSFRPLGSVDSSTSNARIVAATNVDLDLAVRAGRFRRDLLARLRGYNAPVVLPPIRERGEDILAWALRFAGMDPPVRFAPAVEEAEALLVARWLEGLRELRSCVRSGRLASLLPRADEPRAEPETLSSKNLDVEDVDSHEAVPPVPRRARGSDPTRDEIVEALTTTAGNVRLTAHRLGIHRRKLYRLCAALGIGLAEHRPGP